MASICRDMRSNLLLRALLLATPAAAAVASVCARGGSTAPACFVAGDEMPCPKLPGGSSTRCIIKGVVNTSSCCAFCSELEGCNVWTFRAATCHLRTSWQKSRPVPGPCTTGVLSGALPVEPAQSTAVSIRIDTTNVTGGMKTTGSQILGCHTDLGYSNQIRGFYSQRVFGESFENYTGHRNLTGNMWAQFGKGEFSLTDDAPLHGLVAQRITATAAGAGVANRGYNQEGISFSAGVGQVWEGYVFARSQTAVRLRVSMQDYFSSPPKTLASTTIDFEGGNWTQLPFNLTPSAGTTCRSFPADTPPLWCKLGARSGKGDDGHACVQCSGQLAISLETAGSSCDLDYAFFQPGPWGRYKGLPLNKDSVAWLERGGYSLIRTGGTYVEADSDEVPTDPEDTGRRGCACGDEASLAPRLAISASRLTIDPCGCQS
jgi:hypothetical protein